MDDIEESFGVISKVILFNRPDGSLRQLSGSNTSGEFISLTPGNYTAKICSDPENIGVYFELYWRLEGEVTTEPVGSNKYVGGLRIKEIADISSPDGVPVVTKYEYKKFDHANMSSGMGSATPEYIYPHFVSVLAKGLISVTTCEFLAQTSGSLISLSSIQGGNVFYDQVRVHKNGFGYTDYRYYGGGQTSGSYRFPFTPVIAYDWLDGLLIEKTDYKYITERNIYSPVSKTINTYKTSYGHQLTGPHESFVRGTKMAMVKPEIFSASGGIEALVQLSSYKYENYYLYTSWSYPIQNTEITYNLLDTTKNIVVVKDFHYDNPLHIEMTSQYINRSNKQQYKLEMRYPLDIDPSYSYNSSPVVESRKLSIGNPDKLLSADITIYKNEAGSFPLSYYKYASETIENSTSVPYYTGNSLNSSFQKRLDYSYDNSKNITSIVKDNLIRTSYKWGYDRIYPVAECINANVDEFFYEGFEDNGTVDKKAAHTGNKYHVGNYELKWTIPNSRKYTLSYFYFASGKWHYTEKPYTQNTLTLNEGSAYDDIRIFPTDAQISSFTFNPSVGMTSTIDAKGLTTYYDYDEFMRLKIISDNDKNIIKDNIYNYRN